MTEVIQIPTKVACAECGAPVRSLTSFAVSTPLNSAVKPADFCSIGCLMDWSIDRYEAELDGDRAAGGVV